MMVYLSADSHPPK